LWYYRAFGLTLASEFVLPELVQVQRSVEPDVRVRRATLPRGSGGYTFKASGSVADLWVGEANASYRMLDGKELLVESFTGEIRRNQRLYLLGSALAAILHQRKLLPLHACSIELEGKAWVFLGHPGAGKSTLASWLVEQGGRLISDDVSVVRQSRGGRFTTTLGIPRLRLWREVLELKGYDPTEYERSFEGWDKFDVPVHDSGVLPSQDQVPIEHLFLLEQGGDEIGFRRMSGAEAVSAFSANTYRGSYVRLMGHSQVHLEQCVALASGVRLSVLRRPKDLGRMSADYGRLSEFIKNHA
jgi:hypothetical protein